MAVKRPQKIALAILAAGESKRMPEIKQLLPWKNTFLLGHIVEQGLASAADAVFVVLGAHGEIIASKLKPYSVKTISYNKWSRGMGTSIAAAAKFIKEQPEHFDGMLIMLADQPLVSSEHLDKMIKGFSSRKNAIVTTAYDKTAGVPTLFHRDYFDLLMDLDGDVGAKDIIDKNKKEVLHIPSEVGFFDIDTLDDYRKLLAKHGN